MVHFHLTMGTVKQALYGRRAEKWPQLQPDNSSCTIMVQASQREWLVHYVRISAHCKDIVITLLLSTTSLALQTSFACTYHELTYHTGKSGTPSSGGGDFCPLPPCPSHLCPAPDPGLSLLHASLFMLLELVSVFAFLVFLFFMRIVALPATACFR